MTTQYERMQNAVTDALNMDSSLTRMTLNEFAEQCAHDNAKWDFDPVTHEPVVKNKGEQLMLVVTELAEAFEGIRKNLKDDKLPHRSMEEVEVVDALIRLFHYAGYYKLDLDGAYTEKRAFNKTRIDHTHEHRASPNGKKV